MTDEADGAKRASVGRRGFEFQGARAIVTGASSGIGEELACELARRGGRLALVARRRERLEQVAARCRTLGGEAVVLPADLGDLAAARDLAVVARDRLGEIDLLVHNAGIPRRVHAARLTFDDVEETMRVNYLGPMALTFALLPRMLERGVGRIVNVSSIAGRLPAPREAAYSAAKAAVTMMAEVLAADLRGTGVHVHLVTPGVIDTPLWQVEGQEASPYKGTPTPPIDVVRAIVRMLESGRFEAVVPRRFRGAITMKALMGERFLSQTARYDRRNAPQAYHDLPGQPS